MCVPFLVAWTLAGPLLCAQVSRQAPPKSPAVTVAGPGTASGSTSPTPQRPSASPQVEVPPPSPPVPAIRQAESLQDAEDGEELEGAEEEEDFPQEPVSNAAPRGNSLARQVASVHKQIGRGRAQGAFFISSWFSDAPSPDVMASSGSASFEAPEDCDPLDNTVAEAYIRESAQREGVNPDLVREIVRKESGFKPCAVSPKGAMGMMQLTPDTAQTLGVGDPFDARQNIDGGVRLLKRLMEKYKGRPDLALAAYNAGEGAVDSSKGIPDYEETKEYVKTIMQRVFEEKPRRRRPATIAPIPTITPPTATP